MSTRSSLVCAASQLLAVVGGRPNHQRVAALIGCSRTMVSKIAVGERDLSDDKARRLADGLRDHAARAESLARYIEAELERRPVHHRRGTGPRDVAGQFVGCAQ